MFYNKEFVYFITDGTAIKIGYSSRDIAERISELQTGNPRALKLLALIPCYAGTAFNKEQELHARFEQYKVQNGGGKEWFQDVAEIQSFYKLSLTDSDTKDTFQHYIDMVGKFQNGINSHIWNWTKENLYPLLSRGKTFVIIAPWKSGKRKMVQALALMYPYAKHIIITAQNKRDMQVQENEHKDFGITYISATSLAEQYDDVVRDLKKELNKFNGEVFIHYDECDFGAGRSSKDSTKSVHNRLKTILGDLPATIDANIKFISYSATPEEAVFESPDFGLIYTPPLSYCGAAHYYNDTIEAKKFFIANGTDFNFSDQGMKAMKHFNTSDLKCAVLRITYNENKRSFYNTLKGNDPNDPGKELKKLIKSYGWNITPIFIDTSNSEQFSWFYKAKDKFGNCQKGFWSQLDGKFLIIINKVAERGTEIGFHPDIAFWHDWIGDKTSYATAAQRLGRLFFFSTFYGSFNPDYDPRDFQNMMPNIRLYCNKDVLKLMKDVYEAKDMAEFNKIWEDAEVRRPLGNAGRIIIATKRGRKITECSYDFNNIAIYDAKNYNKEYGTATIDGFNDKTTQKYVDAVLNGVDPGTYKTKKLVIVVKSTLEKLKDPSSESAIKLQQLFQRVPQIKRILESGYDACIEGIRLGSSINQNNKFEVRKSIHTDLA